MTNPWRAQARIAALLQARLVSEPSPLLAAFLPTTAWLRLLQLRRQLALAVDRGWNAARREILRRLDVTLDDLLRQLQNYQVRAHEEQQLHVVPHAEIVGDLAALDEEFPSVEITFRPDRITVETEPVELDGHDLGSFRIVPDRPRPGRPARGLPVSGDRRRSMSLRDQP